MPTFSPPLLLSRLLARSLAFGLALAATPAMAQEPMPGVQLAQVTIEQRVIIRIPLVRPTAPAGARPTTLAPPIPPVDQSDALKEVKGPKCLKLDKLRGALINAATGTVTMLTDKEERFRTHFGRMCRAADFYSGFYIQPNKDGSICVGRDMLHARNGSTCDIERFGKLVPDDDD